MKRKEGPFMNFDTRPVVIFLTMSGIVTFGSVAGGLLAQASPSGYAPHGTVTIDGATVEPAPSASGARFAVAKTCGKRAVS